MTKVGKPVHQDQKLRLRGFALPKQITPFLKGHSNRLNATSTRRNAHFLTCIFKKCFIFKINVTLYPHSIPFYSMPVTEAFLLSLASVHLLSDGSNFAHVHKMQQSLEIVMSLRNSVLKRGVAKFRCYCQCMKAFICKTAHQACEVPGM